MWISLNSMSNILPRRRVMSDNHTPVALEDTKCPYSIRIPSPNIQLISPNPRLDLVQPEQEGNSTAKAISNSQLKSQNLFQGQVEQAVQEEETIMCEICTEKVKPNSIFKNGSICAHRFCTNCMSRYIQGKLDDNVSDIPCPATTCSLTLDPVLCRPRVSYQLFNKWCDKLCEAAVSLVERVYCPNIECAELILSECDDNPKRSECPSCNQLFCFDCNVPWHDGFSCEEIKGMGENDVAFHALCKKKKWKRCPNCRHVIARSTGCNHMKCRCGAEFCYKCAYLSCVCSHVSYRLRSVTTRHVLLFIIDLLLLLGTHMLNEGVYREYYPEVLPNIYTGVM